MKFRAAVGDYIRDQQSLGSINSDKTVRIYVQRLNVLADQVSNRHPGLVGRDDIRRTLRRWSPSSQAHARSIYISFFKWCVQEGLAKHNPAEQTPRPRFKRAERYRLTLAETHAIAAAATGSREVRAVHLAVFAGLRNQELRGVQGQHFQRPGWIWVSADIGKGGRERWIPVLPELEHVVAEIRSSVMPGEYVLPGRRPSDQITGDREVPTRPLSASTLGDLVRTVASRAGIAGQVGPHTLRHAFCDYVRRTTGDVGIAQALMGHANIQTTQGYMARPSLDELASALQVAYRTGNGADLPAAVGLVANDPSHSNAALRDPVFWLGVRLGAQNSKIRTYLEHFGREAIGA